MKKLLLCAFLGVLGACSSVDTNTTYEREQLGIQGRVEYGQIVDVLPVKVEGTSEVGTLGGAVAGAAAGSMIGGNTATNIIGGVGGALLGGAIGGSLEKSATTAKAYEFVIKKNSGHVVSVVQTNELNLRIGDEVYMTIIDGRTRIRGKTPVLR